ncbi:24967_t:CDS:1, partial [Gigaspora margarita]
MDRLSLETLKMLCKGEGLSDIGAKKELVDKLASRIVDKAKERDRGEENSWSKDVREGRVDIDSDFTVREGNFDRRSETSDGGAGIRGFSTPDLRYVTLERALGKTVQATMEKVIGDFSKCVQPVQSVGEYKYWPKEEMNKPRDQFEYNEWCKIGRYLDCALMSRDWDLINKARDVAATRAFALRVANREGWD